MLTTRRKDKRRGSQLIEFTLLGVPIMFLSLGAVEVSLVMWDYHTTAEAVQVSARYISMHGSTCTQNGNSCTITVGNIVSYMESNEVGLDPSKLDVTLTSTSSSVPCNPLNSCASSTSTFPPTSDSAPGNDVQVTATYAMNNPLVLFWPGAANKAMKALTLGATSTQRIVF